MTIWTIAGSDNSAGAGIQADLQTAQNLGVHCCTIITAVTAQNNSEVTDIHYVPAHHIAAQIEALAKEFPPAAIKLGMQGDYEGLKVVVNFLRTYNGFIIVDPVLAASSGNALLPTNRAYRELFQELLGLAHLITPNLAEVESLLGQPSNDVEEAASALLNFGCKSVLIKGGHANDPNFSQDYWSNGIESFWLSSPRLQNSCRGTGCSLASAIAANIALGYDLKDALVIGKMYIQRRIRNVPQRKSPHPNPPPRFAGGGKLVPSPQNCFLFCGGGLGWGAADLPYFSSKPITTLPTPFPNCGPAPLGLYPIVESVDQIKQLLNTGITTIQLRVKNKNESELRNIIQQSIELVRDSQIRLFINDYWQLAIEYGAYGVHLGQEDLENANMEAIRIAELRLGISTHSFSEVARAHAIRPSYIACGPIYATNSKAIASPPIGLAQLRDWCQILDYPVVAIGGINRECFKEVLATGVNGVAVISAVTRAADLAAAARELLDLQY